MAKKFFFRFHFLICVMQRDTKADGNEVIFLCPNKVAKRNERCWERERNGTCMRWHTPNWIENAMGECWDLCYQKDSFHWWIWMCHHSTVCIFQFKSLSQHSKHFAKCLKCIRKPSSHFMFRPYAINYEIMHGPSKSPCVRWSTEGLECQYSTHTHTQMTISFSFCSIVFRVRWWKMDEDERRKITSC